MVKKILIADDEVDICKLLSGFLQRKGFETETAFSGTRALEILSQSSFDLFICDFRLGDLDGIEMLTKVKQKNPQLPVIIITGYSDIRTAVNVIKAGALDYITKPLIPDDIFLTIKKALEKTETSSSSSGSRAENNLERKGSRYVEGVSAGAKEMQRQINIVAPTDYSVIIYGETGSGKEAVARLIHEKSKRADKPFVAMDCGAIPKDISAGELFGYEKGAFTGAVNSKPGHFEMANGGTLFLDEVGNLSYDVQASLLRVVQERTCRRLGNTKDIQLDVRILVASNENLLSASRTGKFREDLYHRFNEFSIHVAPLRERKDDILPLAEHFLSEVSREQSKNVSGFSADTENLLREYAWPGNVRELKNVIRRAVLMSSSEELDASSFPPEMNTSAGMNTGEVKLKDAAHQAEAEMIKKVLRQVNNNKSKAAEILKIDRKTLYNKLRQFNLED
ncbi:MAG TPA: sigma-54 dependent transcriptional regulator [Bacteroidia bacterium]|nr:sigma-54 dependent transcriptional regulator [Bacteroidia bacterium]